MAPGRSVRERLERAVAPIVQLLRQGTSPERIALSAALGITLSVTPVGGFSTALCTLAAVLLGLNLGSVLAFNFLATPLQLALVVPWIRLGERLFAVEPLPLQAGEIVTLLASGVGEALGVLGGTLLRALVAWAGAAPLLAAAIYLVTLPLVRWGARRLAARS